MVWKCKTHPQRQFRDHKRKRENRKRKNSNAKEKHNTSTKMEAIPLLENNLALLSTLLEMKYKVGERRRQTSAESDGELSMTQQYMEAGLKHDMILDMLSTFHNIKMSVTTLKTRLEEAGLFIRRH